MPPRPVSCLVGWLARAGTRQELADELSTLEAILGEQSVHWAIGDAEEGADRQPCSISLLIDLHLDAHLPTDTRDDAHCQLRLEIPDGYPAQTRPRLVLLAKYLGPFGVDRQLLDSIGMIFERLPSDDPILYEGIQTGKEILSDFYQASLARRPSSSTLDPDLCPPNAAPEHAEGKAEDQSKPMLENTNGDLCPEQRAVVVYSSEPIVDRKSVFIGHSVALDDPKDVPRILQHLLSDKKIAKASHNMTAWRCQSNGFLLQDNDDDGESAAGSRMAHLLNILDVKNVFVCVSRWFGGIHLGSDRFKHINQATKDALIKGEFIAPAPSKSGAPHHQVSPSGFKKKR